MFDVAEARDFRLQDEGNEGDGLSPPLELMHEKMPLFEHFMGKAGARFLVVEHDGTSAIWARDDMWYVSRRFELFPAPAAHFEVDSNDEDQRCNL
jgi:hypothetical protein